METRIKIAGLSIAKPIYDLVRDEICPGTGIHPDGFWAFLREIVEDLEPKNSALLARRDLLQSQIDDWHRRQKGMSIDMNAYKTFLTEIGYLVPEGEDFQIEVGGVDPEIALIAGPQLVVPLDNARYALNAANARWGSLYDALYGTDVIPEEGGLEKGGPYNPRRGEKVFERSWAFLDESFPLSGCSHSEVVRYCVTKTGCRIECRAVLSNGKETGLVDPNTFAGYRKESGELSCLLLKNHNLHVELLIDRDDPIGRSHPAGVKDVQMEAAVTTIQDCEDAVAVVDAEDKARLYRNWLGLMKGSLEAAFKKNGKNITRRLNPDREYTSPNGSLLTLPGRSLMLIRNVGLHMYTDAVKTVEGEEIPEAFLDAMVTSHAAIHDLKGNSPYRNSRAGSIYIVKPKHHGPEEVASSVELFGRVEDALRLRRNTIKIGIMDEERRTTVNLKECIRQARERVIFINTGFLDRTGDEIHTDMEAGAMIPKPEMKKSTWIKAYEDWNVDIGLEAGFIGKAQIGKGMWAEPDNMKAMLETKIAHPAAGASTAWVPSPTAATLHALHYHQVNVNERQSELVKRKRANLDDLLTLPLLGNRILSPEEIRRELENNAQTILGYVVRWVEQGIGCSKVLDIQNVALMEDRATLRISSQQVANWFHHGLATREEILAIFRKMASVVDRQNEGDPNYRSMAPDYENSTAFQAAIELVFMGRERANGYTEWTLHTKRREMKRRMHNLED